MNKNPIYYHLASSIQARLNCITHLLNQIPYNEIDHPVITLPERVHNPDYLRGPVPPHMYVPEIF